MHLKKQVNGAKKPQKHTNNNMKRIYIMIVQYTLWSYALS